MGGDLNNQKEGQRSKQFLSRNRVSGPGAAATLWAATRGRCVPEQSTQARDFIPSPRFLKGEKGLLFWPLLLAIIPWGALIPVYPRLQLSAPRGVLYGD